MSPSQSQSRQNPLRPSKLLQGGGGLPRPAQSIRVQPQQLGAFLCIHLCTSFDNRKPACKLLDVSILTSMAHRLSLCNNQRCPGSNILLQLRSNDHTLNLFQHRQCLLRAALPREHRSLARQDFHRLTGVLQTNCSQDSQGLPELIQGLPALSCLTLQETQALADQCASSSGGSFRLLENVQRFQICGLCFLILPHLRLEITDSV
mmetsp:Transcript_15958/g.35197  ORF Transcript_15958/g.35197 Transcript_15958/m.35197 type:complete len:205 (+) Transcript_15958:730-1344(+)